MAGKQRDRGRQVSAEPTASEVAPEHAAPETPQDAVAAGETTGPTLAVETQPQGPRRARASRAQPSKRTGKRRFKTQVIMTPLAKWQLGITALQEDKDVSELVLEWIEPHLAQGTYPPRPQWLKQLIAESAEPEAA